MGNKRDLENASIFTKAGLRMSNAMVAQWLFVRKMRELKGYLG